MPALLVTLLLLIPAILCTTAARAKDSTDFEGLRIETIRLQADGPLNRISLGDLLKLVRLQEGDRFSLSRARESVQQLYSTELFHDIQVAVSPGSDDNVVVIFRLIRKFLVRKISFEGDVELADRLLRAELAFREGEAYSDVRLEETLARLRELYQTQGFYRTQIEADFQKRNQEALLDIRLQIRAGPQARVRHLEIDTEGEVSEREVLQVIRTREGKRFSKSHSDEDLSLLETHLATRGYLRPDVYLRDGVRYDPETNTVDLIYRVVPRQKTEILFEGMELSPDRLAELPLFNQRGPVQAFLDETAEALQLQLQQEGYFLAKVSLQQVPGQKEPSALLFKVDQGRKYEIAAIRFEGNSNVPDGSLRSLVDVETAGFFSRGKATNRILNSDARKIEFQYHQRGYIRARVEPRLVPANPSEDKLAVLFQITEGPEFRVQNLQVKGNQAVETAILMEEIQLQPGQPFSPIVLAQDRSNLIAFYENLGYRNVDFRSTVTHPQPGQVDLVYDIQEGSQFQLEDIIISGNSTTQRSVVQRELAIQPGDPLSLDKILQSETNLYNLAIFNRVEMNEIPSLNQPTRRSLLIQLEEAKKYTLLYGIGFSKSFDSAASEGVRGTFGITNNNLWGSGRTLSLGLRAGQQLQRGNLSLTLPYLFGKTLPTVLSMTVENEDRISNADLGEDLRVRARPFDSFRILFSSQTERKLSRRESLFFRYNYETVNITVPANLEERVPLQFFREQDDLRLSSLSLTYLNESRDDPAYPSSGFFLNGETQLSTEFLGSNTEFLRILLQGQYYKSLFPGLVLASSLRIGTISPFGTPFDEPVENSVPISERFFSGGATSLRGLPQDLAGPLLRDPESGEVILVEDGSGNSRPVALGGNALLIGNFELRFPIYGLFNGALFYDVGNVFESITELGSSGFSNAVGFGLVLRTPVGPVRLDLGYNTNPPDFPGFNRWNLHINIGHPF